jgi:hypothetical protein
MDYTTRHNKKGEVIIHRTWLKILCNPILRLFGYRIVSIFASEKFEQYSFDKIPKYRITTLP